MLRNLAVQGRVPYIWRRDQFPLAVGSVVPRDLVGHFDIVVALAAENGVVSKDGDQTVGSPRSNQRVVTVEIKRFLTFVKEVRGPVSRERVAEAGADQVLDARQRVESLSGGGALDEVRDDRTRSSP